MSATTEQVAAEYRLDESRRELKQLFAPEDELPAETQAFPRSKTMRFITDKKSLTWLAIGAGGILLARPKLLVKLVRLIPIGTLVRVAAVRMLARRS